MTSSDVARRLALAALLLLPVLIAGCSREPAGFLLLPLVQAKSYTLGGSGDGLSFPKAPEVRAVEVGHERRPAVLTTPGRWRWRGRVPEGARLHVGVQALPQAWAAARALEAEVIVRDGGRREILEVARATAKEDRAWIDFDADLGRYAGRDVTVELSASLVGLPTDRRSANLIAWGPVNISRGPGEDRQEDQKEGRRPNILFILVDTLRHDHLTPYGYRRDTSPEIARHLAARGTVVEDAYSQAPWTLPSVVSFMTGHYPGELLGADLATYGVPEGVPTLAEMLSTLGYETGGFIANPTLHAGAGFGRGFRTFHAPPADVRWMLDKHADDLNARVLPWLSAYQNQDRPFFLYVHYIDPHDPYMNPDMVGGYRSPFMPEYKGPIAGDWVHGIYGGKLQLGDPETDVAHIKALYDNEIRYVDRHIGQLLAAIDPEVLANTLVVLTSDHGEELHDHGGWKHGQSLYEEQIHVPLILRWDGRIPAGQRLGGSVSLLDLVPTLMAAVGGKDAKPDPDWQGISLLPALTGGKPLPRRSVFSQHLSGGPLRAAAIMDRRKLVLFNSREPFNAEDGLQSYLWQKDLQRLKRVELYDLSRDPNEKANLAEGQAGAVAGLTPAIHGRLGRELPGLWMIASAPGSGLSGSIVFEKPPSRWVPYFLAPDDRVELTGNRLRFQLSADTIEKGFRVEGDFGAVLAVEAPAGALRVGESGRIYPGAVAGRLTPQALRVVGWPAAERRGALWMGMPDVDAAKRRAHADPETEKRLRALGYIE